MDIDSYHERIDRAFRRQKTKALAFQKKHNAALPAEKCPFCGCNGHVPGLPCPDCCHQYEVPWGLILDTEWGYAAVSIGNRKVVLAQFNVGDG